MTVVRYFEEELRGLGINVEPWLAVTPQTNTPKKPLSPQRPILPERLTRTRRPVASEELAEGVLRESPVPYKNGKTH